MKKWCKIIELEEHDVLVERVSNDNDGEAISVHFKFPTHKATLTIGFEGDKASEEADIALQKFQRENAQAFLDKLTF